MRVPDVVRNKAIAHGADDWLDSLPDLVADLAREWQLTVGEAFDEGTEAYVVAVTEADGREAVLKLVVPRAGNHAGNEIEVLRRAGGEGCAELYRSDLERSALLLERLGPSMSTLPIPLERQHDILCGLAQQIWRPAPDAPLPDGAAKGRRLADWIVERWEGLDHPCSEASVELAVACAERRIAAHDDERAVLCHGDIHQWNTLAAGDGFKLVDPDGLLVEPEYDLGILMREDPDDLIGRDDRDRAAALAARTGLDPTAIWEWGVVERVSTGLLATEIDLQPVGREMLQVADEVATRSIP